MFRAIPWDTELPVCRCKPKLAIAENPGKREDQDPLQICPDKLPAGFRSAAFSQSTPLMGELS